VDWDVYAFTFQIPSAPSPADEINNLIALVRSLGLLPALESTLVSKLQEALAAVNASDTATACSALTSFISKVQSQSNKKIDPEQKSELINSANQIKTHLGCQ
jgi:FIMAH domain-containing protein